MPRKPTNPPRDQNKINPATYNDVVGRTQIRSIRLLESKFEIKPDAIGVDPSEWRKAVEFELGDVVTSDQGGLYGVLHFTLTCRIGRKRIIQSAAKYLASYRVNGGCSQENGEVFIERVGRVAVYPYFRSLVASLVAEAGLQMPPLPMISLAPRSIGSAAQLITMSAEPKADDLG